MGLLDDLKKLLGETGEKASEEASEEARRIAAKQAWRATRAAVNEVGDDLLGAAEGELRTAEDARKGRKSYGPSASGAADDIAAGIEAAARRADERRRALARGDDPPDDSEQPGLIGTDEVDDPKARARRELERLKAQMKAKQDGAATPPKKTL